jgi:hypothetical protein
MKLPAMFGSGLCSGPRQGATAGVVDGMHGCGAGGLWALYEYPLPTRAGPTVIIGSSVVKCSGVPGARLQLLTQQIRLVAFPMFCRTRSHSRSRTVAASVTTTNGAGDGGRKASPYSTSFTPIESSRTPPAHSRWRCIFGARILSLVGMRTNCVRPSRLGAGLARLYRRSLPRASLFPPPKPARGCSTQSRAGCCQAWPGAGNVFQAP